MTYSVYILRCSDDTLYTGITNNIEKRLMNHNKGKGAKYTRGRLPVSIVYLETGYTLSQARKREIQIKKMNRQGKINLIKK